MLPTSLLSFDVIFALSTLERWFTVVHLLWFIPDIFFMPFPKRSRPGLLTKAAYGGLQPAPARRLWETYSHLSRRLVRHTNIRTPDLIGPANVKIP